MPRRLPWLAGGLAVVLLVGGTRAVLIRPAVAAPTGTSPSTTSVAPTTPTAQAVPNVTPAERPVSAAASANPRTVTAQASARATAPASSIGAEPLDAMAPAEAASMTTAVTEPSVVAPTASSPTALTPAASVAPSLGVPGPMTAPAINWRALLATPGVSVSIEEISDASTGTSSMASARAVRTYSNVSLSLDLDSLVGWRGLTIFAQHKTKTGRNGSGEAGFTQNYSNIDAPDFRAMGEVFAEQRLFDDRVRVKGGRLDFNSEFAGTDNGAAFLNASMGFSPSIAAAPTFPLPTWGVDLVLSPRETFTVKLGLYDGLTGAPAAEGASSRFQIAQANQEWALGAKSLPGRVGAGAHRHTGMFVNARDEADAEPTVRGTHGWFATVDQVLWQGNGRGDEDHRVSRSVAAFAQLGYSDRSVLTVHEHLGGGLTLSGISTRRPDDALGIGVTHASSTAQGELIGEFFYKAPLTSKLTVVGDLQRIRRRDGSVAQWMGNVFTLRTVVTF